MRAGLHGGLAITAMRSVTVVAVVPAQHSRIMVPRMLMPTGLQTLSEWSPMGWALDGLQSVFLGEPEAAFILPRAGLLLGFSAVCLALSWWALRREERRA